MNNTFTGLETLYAKCFPQKTHKWTANEFQEIKQSGADIIVSQNSFIVWRTVLDESEIVLIGVVPEARRTGTATALLTLAEQDAKTHGAKTMFLEVADNNIPAHSLYIKNGYIEIGKRPHYYEDGADAIIMKKDL